MAKRVEVFHEDDFDGTRADENIRFSLDGVNYEIDLTAQHAQELRDAFAPYIAHGRKESGRKTRSSAPKGGVKATHMREWAQANGYEISDRGRVPAKIREAYEEAHS